MIIKRNHLNTVRLVFIASAVFIQGEVQANAVATSDEESQLTKSELERTDDRTAPAKSLETVVANLLDENSYPEISRSPIRECRARPLKNRTSPSSVRATASNERERSERPTGSRSPLAECVVRPSDGRAAYDVILTYSFIELLLNELNIEEPDEAISEETEFVEPRRESWRFRTIQYHAGESPPNTSPEVTIEPANARTNNQLVLESTPYSFQAGDDTMPELGRPDTDRVRDSAISSEGAMGQIFARVPHEPVYIAKGTVETLLVYGEGDSRRFTVHPPPWIKVSKRSGFLGRESDPLPIKLSVIREYKGNANLDDYIVFRDNLGNAVSVEVTNADPGSYTSAQIREIYPDPKDNVTDKSIRCTSSISRSEIQEFQMSIATKGMACIGEFTTWEAGRVDLSHVSGGPSESSLHMMRANKNILFDSAGGLNYAVLDESPQAADKRAYISAVLRPGTHHFYLRSPDTYEFISDEIIIDLAFQVDDPIAVQKIIDSSPKITATVDLCELAEELCSKIFTPPHSDR